MILHDSFYTISSMQFNEGLVEAHLKINANHAIFDGHFPENPITPGVVQMEIVKELLSLHFERPINMVSMSNSKFLTILNPNETPEIEVKINVSDVENQLKVSAQIAAGEVTFLKLAGVYC